MTAYDGTARPMLARLIAMLAPRPVWPIQSPIGSATSVAARIDTPTIARCSTSRHGIPVWPCQVAGLVSQAMVSFMPGPPAPPAPGPTAWRGARSG